MASQEHITSPLSPLCTAQMTPNKMEIWPDSKISCVAQVTGQKRAETVQRVPS